MTRVAVVGAGGCVGREMLGLLERDGLGEAPPILYGSPRSGGRTIPFAGEERPVRVLGEDPLEPCDIALFAAGGDVSRQWAPRFVAAGAVVIDNSSAFRMAPEVPLVVPEINGDALKREPGIIANPNCSTIILLLGIHPLRPLGTFRVIASTYQAVSGAGQAGLDALHRERRGGPFVAHEPFPFPIEGNLFPLIGPVAARTGVSGEEQKMILESRKILGLPELEIHVTCVRVPVERCHSESVTLLFDGAVERRAALELLRAAPGLVVEDDAERPPTPGPCAGVHEVHVGRIRTPAPGVLQMWLVGDQLLKGAALNAVQIARRVLGSGHG